jgi:RNA-directed DNA polymerase
MNFKCFYIIDNFGAGREYANRNGFGTHKALRKFIQFCRSSTYVLQCDISKYFPSIDHEILKQLIRRKIKCPDTLKLIELIIDHSNPQELILERFPGDNLLTPIERRKGLPLGNLTSQLFANIYLNPLDRFIKENLHTQKYLRYVDDFALFSNDFNFLKLARTEIIDFLGTLRLKLHPIKTQLSETRYGANFVGFRILNDRIRVVSKNIRRGRKRLLHLCKMTNQGKINITKLHQSLSAWKGHLKHGNTYILRQQLPVCLIR